MRKLKVYLDTSVINFLDAPDALEYQSITREFFDKYLNEYDVYISDIVLLEISKTSNLLRKEQLFSIISKYNLEIYNEVSSEVEELAALYIKKQIIPTSKFEDALHIAFSTVYDFDILLSWNFKHLANIKKQIAINSLNEQEGYQKKLFLTNPMEVIYE